MINRLGLVVHWAGFVCLAVVITFLALEEGTPLELFKEFGRVMFFYRSMDMTTIGIWVGILSWPFKYILTGSKTLFPWNKETADDQ